QQLTLAPNYRRAAISPESGNRVLMSPCPRTAALLLDWPAGDDTMFKIGQYVCYQRHRAEGRFIVISLLPQSKREPRYIIRSEENPEREYTADASELRRVQGGR